MAAGKRLGLGGKLALALGAIVLVILAASGALAIASAHQERLRALSLRADLVSEAMASALSAPIWEYDQDAGAAVLQGALRDPEFLSASARDETGVLFAEVANPALRDHARDLDLVRAMRPVLSPTAEARTIGRIDLVLSRHEVTAALRRQVATTLLVLFLLLAVVTAGMVLAIRKFTRPIEEMTAIMDRRALGDLSLHVDPRYTQRADEIGAIARSLELDQEQRRDEARLLEITSEVSSEQSVGTFLARIAAAATALLTCDRSLLFLHDKKKGVLWSQEGEGDSARRIELRPDEGPVGQVFSTGQVVNRGKEMLCVPIVNREGKRLGVMQVLDDVDQGFTERDERRLRSLAAQAAAALENKQLFEDVLNVKNYNESILKSLSDGVISLDKARRVTRANAAALKLLQTDEAALAGRTPDEIFGAANAWVQSMVERVETTGRVDAADDVDLILVGGTTVSVNANVVPLTDIAEEPIGALLILEDISSEKRVRGTMARYLPKKVVDQLLESGRAVLGGTSQTVTALFTDIRGFTTISEAIGPRDTVSMLNEYFSEMWDVIDAHNGVLDKYIGDAIMAIFGVPFVAEGDADNAVLAANEMMLGLARLNGRRTERGQQAIQIGIGLNTGEAVAGNIGSPKRMAYTVIGDSINLASRLEGATKQYGTPILVSAFTYAHVKDKSCMREVDVIRVKGKLEPVAVYESFAWQAGARDGRFSNAIEQQSLGLRAFRGRDWSGSRKNFLRSLELVPEDRLPRIYLQRIDECEASPPPESWDGVAVMKTK